MYWMLYYIVLDILQCKFDNIRSRVALIIFYFYFRLCKVQRRIIKGMEVFEYYANNQWDFDNSSTLYIRTLLNNTEKIRYKIDAEGNCKSK